MIATHKRGVLMAHVCSECGFPMITIVQIEAVAQKTYAFSQSKAEKIANETAEKAICDEIRNIEACYDTKRPLVGTHEGSSMISPGYFCSSSFSGFASQCPRCLNIEPWKSSSSTKQMDELERDNFPVVFTESDKAEKWACGIVGKMIVAIEEKRRDETAVKDAVKKVIESKIKINALIRELKSIGETSERDRLRTELSKMEEIKSQLGIFDIKGRKTVNEKIKNLQTQVKNLNEIIERKETPITKSIVTLENKLLTIQSIAFGCSNIVSTKKYGDAFSYFLSPNSILNAVKVETL